MNEPNITPTIYQHIFLNAPYPVLLLERTFTGASILQGNHAFLNSALLEHSTMSGKRPEDLFCIENKRSNSELDISLEEAIQFVVKSGQPIHLENKGFCYLPKSGIKQLLFVGIIDITPLQNEKGETSYLMMSILPCKHAFAKENNQADETENLKMELELSDRHLNNIIEGTSAGTWDWDIRTGDVKRKGAIFDEFLGENSNHFHIHNNTWQSLIHPDDIHRVLASNEAALQNKDVHFWEEDFRLKTTKQTYKWVRDRGYIMRDKNGKAIRALGATQNVSEKHDYIEAIEEQNVRLREIAWMQSHVVRAPLARMMGIVDVVQSVNLSPEEFKAFTRHFIESAKELDAIIHDISNKTITQQRPK